MSRKSGSVYKKHKIEEDHLYGSVVISKFINIIMDDGKKEVARGIVYGALEYCAEKSGEQVLQFFEQVLDNLIPSIELRSCRIGGSNYQIPHPISRARGLFLVFGWLKKASLKRKGKSMIERLSIELMDAHKGIGEVMKTKETMHKMAEANRAYANLRWANRG